MRKATSAYLIVNFGCMLLFAYVVLRIQQRINLEKRTYSDFGDNLYFFISAVPAFSVSLVYSIGWGIASLIAIVRRRAYQGFTALGLVVVSWIGLFFVLKRFS